MRTDDPEGIINQLSDVRRQSLDALGRDLDDLEQRVDPFMEEWRSEERARSAAAGAADRVRELHSGDPRHARARRARPRGRRRVASPGSRPASTRRRSGAGRASPRTGPTSRTATTAVASTATSNGCAARASRSVRSRRSSSRTIVAWCAEHDEDPEEARAAYAAHRMRDGEAIPWPPGRNEPCWCGSGRKYKKCCGPARPVRCMIRRRSSAGDKIRWSARRTDHCQIAGADRQSRRPTRPPEASREAAPFSSSPRPRRCHSTRRWCSRSRANSASSPAASELGRSVGRSAGSSSPGGCTTSPSSSSSSSPSPSRRR